MFADIMPKQGVLRNRLSIYSHIQENLLDFEGAVKWEF